uniref:Exonuclease domain-containing protein n=1 Tax=Caenorhabditis tropicalis TaxID=1561998 RepID=A0A1I7T2A8_9PELO
MKAKTSLYVVQSTVHRQTVTFTDKRIFHSTKASPFVDSSKLVKSREVKVPPRYPKFVEKRRANKMSQHFEYLLVLDFEATCQENSLGPMHPVQEIIEFPVVQLSTADWSEVRRFHKFVRPTVLPKLTAFCTSLTGIIQEMVDDKTTLPEVLADFDQWMKEDSRLKNDNFAFVLCGDWDLKVALPNEAKFKNLQVPEYFNQWINVKKAYAAHTNHYAKGMPELLRIYNLELKGRHHSGIDDVANICEIVRCLGKDGHDYRITSSNHPTHQRRFFREAGKRGGNSNNK